MKEIFISFLIIAVVSVSAARAHTADLCSQHPQDSLKSEQLIIVLTDSWNSIRATLYGVEKIRNNWVIQFSFPVVLGHKGIAIDKSEGDLKSPAGIFHLGPAFGYANKKEVSWIRIPYICASDTLICVDDAGSHFYNQLIDSNSSPKDWHSHEEMHRKDNAYAWGLFVQYNVKPVAKGKGSCIFLHIWENDHEGTAGCTAMEESNLLKLLRWIQADKNPQLMQYPIAEYKKVAAGYKLPDL